MHVAINCLYVNEEMEIILKDDCKAQKTFFIKLYITIISLEEYSVFIIGYFYSNTLDVCGA